MCEIHVSGCQFCIHECVKAQRIPVEVKPVVIWGFWKTYPWSSKLMDGWRNVCPKTSQVMAIRKITTPRMVARGAGECDDRICFALWEGASIAFHPREGSHPKGHGDVSHCENSATIERKFSPIRIHSHLAAPELYEGG